MENKNTNTLNEYDKMCDRAAELEKQHKECFTYCSKHHKFHSTATIIINIFVSSVLFASLAKIAESEMQWIAAILVLFSGSCAAINRIKEYPERETSHENTSKRLLTFINSCSVAVAKKKDGRITDKTLDVMLDQHTEEFNSIIKDSRKPIK